MILDEPTRGIDVGAKYEIYSLIAKLAAEGMAVILISSELPEMMGMADRVITFCEGRITAEFTSNEIEQERIVNAAFGFQTQRSYHKMKTTKTKDLRSSTMRFLIDNKAMLLALLALIAASVISPTFFSFQNLRNVIRQNTTYFVLAFGFTCVLSSGNIDLSVGLMTGMLGIFVGIMDVRMGLPWA